MADAIHDRLVHNAHKITLKGDGMRKHNTKRLDDKPDDRTCSTVSSKAYQTVQLRRILWPFSIEFTDRLHQQFRKRQRH